MRRLLIATCCLAAALPARSDDERWRYTVVRGDTLIGIATRELQEPKHWRELQRLSGIRDPRRLPVGRVLEIPPAWLRPQAAVATLALRVGAVERREAGGSFAPIDAGATLRATDELRTGVDGWALVTLADGSRLQLAPGTRVTLLRLAVQRGSGGADAGFQLHEGRTESVVKPDAPKPRYEIRTPHATLGVRGTEFRASADAEASRAEVTAGTVQVVHAAAGTLALPAGRGVVATAAGLSPPHPLRPAPDLAAQPEAIERLPLQLGWGGDALAIGFRVQLRDADDPRRVLRDGRFADPRAAWPDQPDPPDGRYLLRVRAIDEQGLEGADTDRVVTLQARPEPPVTLAPRPEARQYGPEAAWAWARRDQAARYRLQVAATPDFAASVLDRADLAGTELRLPLAPGRWYWRLASLPAEGRPGPWGDALAFEQREIPPPPTAAAPQLEGDTIALRWSRRAPGDRYRVQIARDEAFADLLLDQETAEPGLTLPRPAPGPYRLRVMTLDGDGYAGPWGTPSVLEVPVPLWWWLAPLGALLLVLP